MVIRSKVIRKTNLHTLLLVKNAQTGTTNLDIYKSVIPDHEQKVKIHIISVQ